jgi:hypothetical protein
LGNITQPDHILFVSESVVYRAHFGSFEAVVDAKDMAVTVFLIFSPSGFLEDFGKLSSHILSTVGETGE